jgi:hypothetical protein
MLKTKQIQLPPTLKELKNGTLWHTITIPFGDYSGHQTFFTGGILGTDTNIYNCSLPPTQEFIVKKISLMPALDALPNDVNTLISNSHFRFDTAVRTLYEGPAQTFYKGSQNLNEIFLGIKKLPKKTQQAILENMKIPSGFELAEPGKHPI